MEKFNLNYYIKIVVSPKTPNETIKNVLNDLEKRTSENIDLVIQPVSPIELWDNLNHLFELSEIIGEKYPVSILPQIHKYLGIA